MKTKEHVIPQWLMRLTGDPKRIAGFSSIGDRGKNARAFAFDAFHFPACDTCNNDWAALEDKAKVVVEKILRSGPIKPEEWNTLLDWFDKVRVGLWLGMQMLDKNFLEVEPKFHIAKRVSLKDRTLVITKARHGQRLTFFGSNTLAFNYMPSCFGLTINDTTLLNVSYEFLLSERLGFPYPIEHDQRFSGDSFVKITKGKETITLPPLDLHVTACGTAIHQVVYKNWRESEASEVWTSEHVKDNSVDHESGLSVPFLELESGHVSPIKAAGSREWVPKHVFANNTKSGQYLAGFCLDVQSMLWRKWVDFIADAEEKKFAVGLEKLVQEDLHDFRKVIDTMK
ncbi:hypothetical protein ACXZ1M_24320 [Duganella sp. PWIR1]